MSALRTALAKDGEQVRFFRSLTVAPSGCWEFRVGSDKHYASFRLDDGSAISAHRWAAKNLLGEEIAGRVVGHKCDNRRCANPGHLFVGSQQDNIADMWSKGRARPVPNIGEKHGCAKLTEADVMEIRNSPLSARELEKRFPVGFATICRIRRRETWKHVD